MEGGWMEIKGSISRLLLELEVGDQSAAQQAIWGRYFGRLVALARKKLGDVPRRTEDEEDVALCALGSFFEGARQGRFPDLRDRNNLWFVLSKITVRRAINQRKRQLAAKRGPGRVRGESAFVQRGRTGASLGLADFADEEPTPEYVAQLCEECQQLLDKLDDGVLLGVAKKKLKGYTNAEIAAELGVVERTVERKLNRIRKLWSEARTE
jgi:DNA-directed RNA polymerase specialized sigma24 family protein